MPTEPPKKKVKKFKKGRRWWRATRLKSSYAFRPFNCMDTFTPCIFFAGFGATVFEEGLNLGTIFHNVQSHIQRNFW
jgi:hypothetical protein